MCPVAVWQVCVPWLANFPVEGDGCRRDADGYYWITGRVDDVLNVSGHRIGTAEVESALVSHPACVEAAVVAVEHSIKGQSIYAFVTLMTSEWKQKRSSGRAWRESRRNDGREERTCARACGHSQL